MSIYTRWSRKCDLDTMTPSLAAAIREWGDDLGLGGVVESAVACCETVSERRHASGIYGRMRFLPRRVLCGAILTPAWLVWATIADDGEPRVIGVRLSDFQIVDYKQTSDHRRIPDSGLQIVGRIGEDAGPQTVFLGLGEDPPGNAFADKVLAACRAAHPGLVE